MVAHSGKGWRLAPALVALESEVNARAPRRSTASDGSIGDTAHGARKSDHNPRYGWVHALDLTHDPAGGFDAHGWARDLARRGDRRVSYIISNGEIHNPAIDPPGRWRRYSGSNPHRAHVHVSVTDAGRGDGGSWFANPQPQPKPDPEPAPQVDPAEVTMFIALDNGKRYAEVGTVIVGLSEADYQRCYAASRGVPVMALPGAVGELAINASNAAAKATATGKAQAWPFKK